MPRNNIKAITKFIFLILSLGLCFACSNKESSKEVLSEPLVAQRILSIKTPSQVRSSYLHTQVFADSLLYGLDPASPYEIAVFDLRKERFLSKIVLDPNFFKEKLGAFYVHNPDSIFVTGMNYPWVYIISSTGKIIQKFDLKAFGANKDFVIPSLFPYTSPYFDGKRSYLYITTLPYDWDRTSSKNQMAQTIFDLKNRRLVSEYASLSNSKEGILPYDLNIPYRLMTDKEVIVSHPVRHDVEIYDRLTHQRIGIKKAGLANEINLPEPVSSQSTNDEQLLWNYRITTPFYEPLFYHSKSKIFTRILHHQQDLKPNGITLNDGEKRKATLLVFDKDFNLLKSHDFKNGTIGVRKVISMSEGLLIAPHEHYWKTENELVYKNFYKL